MNFNVVMLATAEISHYADQTAENWEAYCQRHGYSFERQYECMLEDMHIVWSKVALVKRQLERSSADWIVFVDADTRVNRPLVKLDSLVSTYPGKQMLISEDCSRRLGVPIPLSLQGPLTMRRWRAGNTGFMMFQNSRWCAGMVARWLDLGRGELSSISDVFPREQMVFWKKLYHEYKEGIAVIGQEIMRMGFESYLDPLTLNTRTAFVHHDKSLPDWPGSK